MNKFRKLLLLLSEIGIPSLAAYVFYRFQLGSGSIASTALRKQKQFSNPLIDLNLIDKSIWLKFNHNVNVGNTSIDIADEITRGFYRPFGGDPAPLDLALPQPLRDWTVYSDIVEGKDIKTIWEPARFSWALYLARGYSVTSKESYLETFWQYFEQFCTANPAYLGPNWVSAQEVALRAINWLMILPTLAQAVCTTPARMELMLKSLWQHLVRIPPTIAYAKSQNNNHLLSESLGLYLLGNFFSAQSSWAGKWCHKGAQLFENALLQQIEPDGTFTQHSAIYHRLMLHLALLYDARKRSHGESLPEPVKTRLAAATAWVTDQLDRESGHLPNLGHNDGSLLLPPGCREYNDFRPTVQAANAAFRNATVLPPGPWDSLARFLNLPETPASSALNLPTSAAVHKIGQDVQWGTLRAVEFHGRPAHADQLHVDLWWDGINIARDAGTYGYNSPPPWQNALVTTRVHNTVSVDRQDQMYPAGKFLFLDRAQAYLVTGPVPNTVGAYHHGYRRKGVTHTRTLTAQPGSGFSIRDKIDLNRHDSSREVTLHWLLPDWQWQWNEGELSLGNSDRWIRLIVTARNAIMEDLSPSRIDLIRAGKALLGSNPDEIMGWVSPTYGVRQPALSLSLTWLTTRSLELHSEWLLMKGE